MTAENEDIMRSTAECEKAVQELRAKIDAAASAIASRQAELDSLKDRSVKLLEQNLHKERLPKSIRVQRRNMLDSEQRIEELKAVRASLEGRLSAAAEELSLARLQERVIEFKQSEEAFFEAVKEAFGSLSNVGDSIECLKENVMRLGRCVHPVNKLLPVLKELKGKLCLQDFVEKAEAASPDPKDIEFIDSMMAKYRNLQRELPALGDLNGIGLALVNQLSWISSQAAELRHLKKPD
jgi:chromosome segregation ATPase